MDWHSVWTMCQRAFVQVLMPKRLGCVATVLALCGFVIVLFDWLVREAGVWRSTQLLLFPWILTLPLFMAMGVVLSRLYRSGSTFIPGQGPSSWELLKNCWDAIGRVAPLTTPCILANFLLWLLMGVFYLIFSTPMFGPFFSILFAFVPFLLNFATYLFITILYYLAFYLIPFLAIKKESLPVIVEEIKGRVMRHGLFGSFLIWIIASVPIFLLYLLTSTSAQETASMFHHLFPLHSGIHSFPLLSLVLVIPLAICLSPGVLFFFNLATEHHMRGKI